MSKLNLDKTKALLLAHPEARGDGAGIFLNLMHQELFGDVKTDFTKFNTETWSRSRRKVLEQFPYLDNRTVITKECEEQIKSEVT